MRIFRFDEINSTNTYLKNMENIENYDCVIAKTQTAGVGRRGNIWVSNIGMALFSFALKEEKELSQEEYMKLPLIAGISLLSGLKKIVNLDYRFKWTNDIYIKDKKLSGILIEKIRDYYIIGIGINVNNGDFGYAQETATSLKNETGDFFLTEDIIFCVINEFNKYFENFKNGKWNEILEEINSYNYLKNKKIEIFKYGENIGEGIAKNIASDGTLEVEINNEIRYFNIGEIHIKK